MLAHYFGVSRESLVRRLEEVGLVRTGTWDWFEAHGGITDQQARDVLGDAVRAEGLGPTADRPASMRLGLMAAEVWRKDLLSEGQLARLLRLDRVSLRTMIDAFDDEQADADGALVLAD